MVFTETPLKGAYLIDVEPNGDDRGFFARAWCRREFQERGLVADLAQCSISFNKKKGTLRGMHYQAPPHQEAKLVMCTKGGIYDVIIDLRRDSPTFRQWTSVMLTAANRKMLYVPKGFAHGFLTMLDDSDVLYMISEFYHPESARGVRWNDPTFGITWPTKPSLISVRDNSYGAFQAAR